VTPEAERILEVFKSRQVRAGGLIHQADFGNAIVWEGGFVRDEVVRDALKALFENGYLLEHATAFELTELGDAHLYCNEN
jgi:hypothetical protein